MNQFEEAVIDGAKAAQEEYGEMTGGWWLSHGPESFLAHAIATKLKEEFWIYPEASPKKIIKERNSRPRGPSPKNLGQRFDIVVWAKSINNIRAIIEVKKAWNITSLANDRKKIAIFLKRNKFVKSGYLLAYTEARRFDTLSKRLDYWAKGLDCKLVQHYIDPQGDGEWFWAIGLFRLPQFVKS